MRKIVHQPSRHNVSRGLTFGLALAALIALAGCGDNSSQTQDNSGAEQTEIAIVDCPVDVNLETWDTFAGLADRLAAGETVPRSEVEAYANSPAVTKWRRSQTPNVPQASNMANWIEGAWWEEQGQTGRKKLNTNRVVIGRLYRYSQENRADIDAMLDEFMADGLACQAYDRAISWVDQSLIPNPLVLNFVPAAAEVRIFEDEVFVDTSVLRAGGPKQTSRQVAALLYRKFGTLVGSSPKEVSGAASVAECVRLMMNEGIASTVEGTLAIEFDRNHPSLYKVHITPDSFFRKSQETVRNLEKWLTPLFVSDEAMAAGGLDVARSLIGNNALGQMGLGMAAVIDGRLGRERLHQVNGSVSEFLAAYQEAALMNTNPAPDPGAVGIELYESVPPMSPALYDGLQAIVNAYFPVRHYSK